MADRTSYLILGAGELGLAVLRGVTLTTKKGTEVTVLLRPETANLPRQAPKVAPIYALPGGVKILSCDLGASSESELAEAFKPYDVIIGCTGYANNEAGNAESLQMKIARAVLASKSVKLYVPWQFGVDYDKFERGAAGGLFDDQKDVRELLRSAVAGGETHTKWLIVSTGVFMSYLFSDFWGVVQEASDGWVVNALNSWETSVTVTTADDIGHLTAQIMSAALDGHDETLLNRPVFIAGDTVSYSDLVHIVGTATGKSARRGEVLDVPTLIKAMEVNPDEVLAKYRVAFARNEGVAWPKTSTFNGRRGVEVTDARIWAKTNLL